LFPFSPGSHAVEALSLAFLWDRSNNNRMSDVVQSVRQLLQDFIAPELRELKSDVKGLDLKIDSETESLTGKIDSESKSLTAKIDTETKSLAAKIDSETARLEEKIASESRQLGADFKRLESKMDSGFAQLHSMLENANLRAELEATRDIANLRERVTRLETERGMNRQ
jgi:outer membrane murein-binding lipoprotein Lpp